MRERHQREYFEERFFDVVFVCGDGWGCFILSGYHLGFNIMMMGIVGTYFSSAVVTIKPSADYFQLLISV